MLCSSLLACTARLTVIVSLLLAGKSESPTPNPRIYVLLQACVVPLLHPLLSSLNIRLCVPFLTKPVDPSRSLPSDQYPLCFILLVFDNVIDHVYTAFELAYIPCW